MPNLNSLLLSDIGEVVVTYAEPVVEATASQGYLFSPEGFLYVTITTTPQDSWVGGKRFSPFGQLVVEDGLGAARPYFFNAGLPTGKVNDGLIRQEDQVPAAADPYVNGVRVGPRGGVYVVNGDAPVAPTIEFDFMTGSLPTGITLTRTTVGTYFDVAGVMQIAAINAPRFDHDPVTHVLKGLLIEDAATNLLLNSNAPVTQSVTVTAVQHALSFYGTGTITLSGTGTGTLVGAGAFPARATLLFTPTAGSLTVTLSGSVQQFQLETGYQATSYIQTAGASVARGREQVMWTGATFTSAYNATAGSVEVEVLTRANVPSAAGSTQYGQLGTSAFSANRVLGFEAFSDGSLIRQLDTGTASNIYSGPLANTLLKIIGNYDRVAVTKRGTAQGRTPSGNAVGAAATGVDRLVIGAAGNFASVKPGWYQVVRYWNYALTDVQMSTWTDDGIPPVVPAGTINYYQAYSQTAGAASWVVQNRPPASAELAIINGKFALGGTRYPLFFHSFLAGSGCLPKNPVQRDATIARIVSDGVNAARLRGPMGSLPFSDASAWGMWKYAVTHPVVAERLQFDPDALVALDHNIDALLAGGVEVIYIDEEIWNVGCDRSDPPKPWGTFQSRGMGWSDEFNTMEWNIISGWLMRPSSTTGIAPIMNPRIALCFNNEIGISDSYTRLSLTAWNGSAAMNWFDKIVDGITDTSGDNGYWYPELNAKLTAWKTAFAPTWTIPAWGRGSTGIDNGVVGFPKRSVWFAWATGANAVADRQHIIDFLDYLDVAYINLRIDQMRAYRNVVINPGTFAYQTPAATLGLTPARRANTFQETHNYYGDNTGQGVKLGSSVTRKSVMDGTWAAVQNGGGWQQAIGGIWSQDMAFLSGECGQYGPNRWRYQRLPYEVVLAGVMGYDLSTFNESQQYTQQQYLTDGRYMSGDHVNVASSSDRLSSRCWAPVHRFGFIPEHSDLFVINSTRASLSNYQYTNSVVGISAGVYQQSSFGSNGSENGHWGTKRIYFEMDDGVAPTTDWTLYPKIIDATMGTGVYLRNTASEKYYVQWGFGLQLSNQYMCGFVDTITQTPKFAMPMTISALSGGVATGFVCFLRSDGLWPLFTGPMKLYIYGSDFSSSVVNQGNNGGTYMQGAPGAFGANNPPGAAYFLANDAVTVYYQNSGSSNWGDGSSDKAETWLGVPPTFTLSLVSPVNLTIKAVKHNGLTVNLASSYVAGTWSFNYTSEYAEFIITPA